VPLPVPALLLALSAFASAENGVAVSVTAKYDKEPAAIQDAYANPCAYDKDGHPIAAPHDCAGVVKAFHHPGMEPVWKIDQQGNQVTSYLESLRVPLVLEQELRISSDYSKDSCAYKATLEHERKHWAANIFILGKTAVGLKRSLARLPLPSKDKPLVSSSDFNEHLRDQIDALIHSTIDAKRQQMSDDMRDSVAELDDPLRYKEDDYSKCSEEQWKGKRN
jgi:hypothetical protein